MHNPPPLPPPLATAEDLLALAQALEQEAASRYQDLAARMQGRGEADLARLFTQLAEVEGKHARQVESRSLRLFGTPPDPARVRWDLPENFDEEAARSASLTPYAALVIAVRNEERAFAFYCHVAAAAPPAVAAIAEDLAREELDHAAWLRRARREAWRREGRRPRPVLPEDVAALRNSVMVGRAAMARLHAALALSLQAAGEAALAVIFRQIAEEEASGIVAEESCPGVQDGLRVLEEEFERLADIAARSSDSAMVALAQEEAERTLRWLARAGGAWRNELLQPVAPA
ncbi:Ferritin family protein [Rhodovastum atsumiense]|nr:ferritin family protein [Rhodovastum atsumiense]CAH2601388.1 Ferritin family protein [Rhodovastum atsumiense]